MNIELLSPVGGWSHLVAAVNNGADAVYMGGTLFNARIFAENFTDDDLPGAIDYAHKHNVKVYITFNTLVKDSELVRAFEYANHLYEIGADALIVQDMGLARLVYKYLPDFPIHLSTQGTLYNTHAVDLAHELGFSRIVPARELSMAEIKNFTAECHKHNVETEVFVHGALCMCYSGQCQLSRGLNNKIEGRSGNRGTCAQPCRQAYTDDNGTTSYMLSPKDLCYIEALPDLIEAGVDSFKIEGRIKTPEYVAIVTRIYRKYIDKYLELRKNNDASAARMAYSVSSKDMQYLKQAFNRGGFSQGYLYGNPGDKLLSGASPKNQGVFLGKVVAIVDSEYKVDSHKDKSAVRGALRRNKTLVCIDIRSGELNMGDGIEFRGDIPSFDSNPIGSVTTYVSNLGDGLWLVGDFDNGVEVGDDVFKVTDNQMLIEAMSAPEKKLPVTMLFTARIGQYISLVMTDVKAGYSVELNGDHIIEKAFKTPTGEDRIIEQLCRLGDTPYYADWTNIDIELDEDAMVPVSLINRLRRDLADQLLDNRIHKIKREREALTRGKLDVIESGEELGRDVLNLEEYRDGFGSLNPVPLEDFMAGAAGTPFILNVSKGRLDDFIENNFDKIVTKVKDTGILIGNLGWIKQFRDAGVKVYGDYGLNMFNKQAEIAYGEMGVTMYAPSQETGVYDSRGLALMITEHPIESSYIVDRKGASHTVIQAASQDKWIIK